MGKTRTDVPGMLGTTYTLLLPGSNSRPLDPGTLAYPGYHAPNGAVHAATVTVNFADY